MVFRFARRRENFKHRPPGTLKMAALQRSRYTAVGYVSLTVAAYLPKSGSREGELCGGGGEGSWKTVSERIFRGPRVSTTWKQLCPPLIARPRDSSFHEVGLKAFPGKLNRKPFWSSDRGTLISRPILVGKYSGAVSQGNEDKRSDGIRVALLLRLSTEEKWSRQRLHAPLSLFRISARFRSIS